MKTLILSVILSICSTVIAGVGSGGGGAGTIINGKYYTFGELGVELVGEGPKTLPEDALEEVYSIVNNNSFPKNLFWDAKEQLLGKDIFYREFKTTDPKRLEAIRKEYQNSIKDPKLTTGSNFAMYAYTWNQPYDVNQSSNPYARVASYTELYPDFYNLTSRQQALILIHEAFVRKFKERTNFTNILKVDIELTKVLKEIESGNQNADFSYLLKAVYDIGGSYVGNFPEEVLKQAIKKNGKPLPLNQIGIGYQITNNGGYCIRISPELAFRNRKLHTLFFETFNDEDICFKFWILMHNIGSQNYWNDIDSEPPVQNEGLNNFVLDILNGELRLVPIDKTASQEKIQDRISKVYGTDYEPVLFNNKLCLEKGYKNGCLLTNQMQARYPRQ